MSDQSNREPFFGPLPNILKFVAFILTMLLIRTLLHREHERAIAQVQPVHSSAQSEPTHSQ